MEVVAPGRPSRRLVEPGQVHVPVVGTSRSRTTTRRPPPRRQSGGLSRAVGRGLRGGWNLLAKGVGGIARTMGRTKDLDPAHRRDGLAFGLIAIGVIAGAGIWWHAAGPVGHYLELGVRSAIGAAAMALPMVLLVIGITLMRSDPQPEKRPRLVIGTLLFVLAFLGILHLFSDLPDGQRRPDVRRRRARLRLRRDARQGRHRVGGDPAAGARARLRRAGVHRHPVPRHPHPAARAGHGARRRGVRGGHRPPRRGGGPAGRGQAAPPVAAAPGHDGRRTPSRAPETGCRGRAPAAGAARPAAAQAPETRAGQGEPAAQGVRPARR